MLSKLLLSSSRAVYISSRPVVNTVRQFSSCKNNDYVASNHLFYGSLIFGAGSVGYYMYDSMREYDTSDYRRLEQEQLKELIDIAKQYGYGQKPKKNELVEVYRKYYRNNRIDENKFIQKSLKDIPSRYVTPELVIDMVSLGYCKSISEIPRHCYGHEVFRKIAMETNSLAMVPKEYQTEELCLQMVTSTNKYYWYGIISNMLNPHTKVFMKAIERFDVIRYIKPEFRTEEMWRLSVSLYPETIIIVDPSYASIDLWAIAIDKEPKMIYMCPIESEELWLIAIKEDPHMVHTCKNPSLKLYFTAYSLDANIAKNIKDPEIKKIVKNSDKECRQRVMDSYESVCEYE